MTTDPARVRRTDPGDPEKCPVWQFHKVYSDEATQDWVVKGCTTAGIGCLDCKQPVIDAIVRSSSPGASAPRATWPTRSRCTGSSRWAPSARAPSPSRR